tara:strand:- start:3 stop:401 length:399 start_codon:yes stop_codon:yes gene_type:complete
MTFWIQIFIAFFIGILVNKLWNLTLYTGYSILILNQIQKDSVKLMAMSAQTIHEIQSLKYLELQKSDKSEKYIEIQKQIDKRYTDPLKNALIANFVGTFPFRYRHLLKFYDWKSAMDYVDQLIKEEKHSQLK